jgi:hypothetical protein
MWNGHFNTHRFERYIPVINFWAGLKAELPHISTLAVKKLLPFPSACPRFKSWLRYDYPD